MNSEIIFSTEPTSTYNIVKYLVIGIGMWIIACGTSACGLSVGGPAGNVAGWTSYLKEANQGAIELQKLKLANQNKRVAK